MRMRPQTALLFLAPALLLYSLIVVYPTLNGLYLSFTNSTGSLRGAEFIGLTNYERMLRDVSGFVRPLITTLIYAALVTVGQTTIGLGLALWMGKLPRLRDAARVALFTPGMLSLIIVGFVWSFIYNPLSGGLNLLLTSVGLESWTRSWLGEPGLALPAVALVNVWMYAGHSAAIFLANYLSIPAELLESATLEGASGWQRFWYIEFPLLAPALTINTALTLIGGLRVFELPFVMTRGGPGDATKVLNLEIFNQAFGQGQDNYGYGSALTVALLLIILALTLIQNTYLRNRELNT
jgi:raffinose/stachyose/melibiose transport system permease protein